MASTRIRYQKMKNGMLQSRRMFITGSGQEVMAELDLANKRYRIVDSVSGAEVASGGNTRNLSVLKIQTKRGLTNLGVVFEEEKRDRSGNASGEAMSAAGN
jgi:hypothetical protein